MTSYVTIFRASISDVLSGQALAAANANSALYSGVGLVLGPWLGSRLTSDWQAFALSAIMSGLNAAYLLSHFKETLAVEDRKEVDWAQCNPLSFLYLFTKGRDLAMLCAAVFCQSVGELRFVTDTGNCNFGFY